LTKYCIISTSELITWIQLLVCKESKSTNAPIGNEEILIWRSLQSCLAKCWI